MGLRHPVANWLLKIWIRPSFCRDLRIDWFWRSGWLIHKCALCAKNAHLWISTYEFQPRLGLLDHWFDGSRRKDKKLMVVTRISISTENRKSDQSIYIFYRNSQTLSLLLNIIVRLFSLWLFETFSSKPIAFGVSSYQSEITIDWSNSLGLFCHIPLKRDQWDSDWRLRLNATPIAIGCTFNDYKDDIWELLSDQLLTLNRE